MKLRCLPLLAVSWNLTWSPQAASAASARMVLQDSQPSPDQPTAPVVIDGVTLFSVRGVSAYPAEQRAARISAAIADLAADRSIPADSLSAVEGPTATTIEAAGRRIFALVDADAELEGVSRPVLAHAYRQRVVEAVQAYRRDREPAVLWNAAWKAGTASLILFVVLWILWRGQRWLRAALAGRYRDRIRDVGYQTVHLVRAEQLWRALDRAVWVVADILALAAMYIVAHSVLLLFPWTRGLAHNLSSIVLGPLGILGERMLGYLPNLVFLLIIAVIARFFMRFTRIFFRNVAEGAVKLPEFEPDWAHAVERIVLILIFAVALVVAYPYLPGSGSEAFKGITILLGLLFSIGSPSVIGNLVAGQSLAFRRVYKVGDRIKVGDHVGEVVQIRLLTTYIRSPKNEQIVIPNALVLNQEVVNYTAFADKQGLILHTRVGIGYGTPWRQVEAMLLEAAGRTPGVLPQPGPFVLQVALQEFAVVYEINVFVDSTGALPRVYTALHRNVLDVFNEYGVQIMTPAYEGDPEQPKVVPRGDWFTTPAQPPADANRPEVGKRDGNATSRTPA